MTNLGFSQVEDINISFNPTIREYVINISYRRTDEYGNVDILSIRDLPIPIDNYPSINNIFTLCDINTIDRTNINLGFGILTADPKFTKIESCRIHTATKEMSLKETENC